MISSATTASETLQKWLSGLDSSYGLVLSTLRKASSDAGFREYWRIDTQEGKSLIAMDASRETQESFDAFLQIDRLMGDEARIKVPQIKGADTEQRLMLLNDLGTQTALNVVDENNARAIMEEAIDILVNWQSISRPGVLPPYDREVLNCEIHLFPEWYVARHRAVTWDEQEQEWWDMSVKAILDNVTAQHRVFVHRDFMLRNFMVTPEGLAVLDFQDALFGPVSYDIASLLRDAFISWNESFVLDMTIRYWEKARKVGIPIPTDFSEFYRDVEFMGLQRHLKVAGIFARLNYRDGKPKYLADTPRFIEYIRHTARRYIALSPLQHLIDNLEGSEAQVGYAF